MPQIQDHCPDGDEFEEILYEAMDNAKPGREEEFCLDVEKSWNNYGLRAFMTEAQWSWLKRLAKTD